MALSGTLSRSQFNQACQLFIRKQKTTGNELSIRSLQGWDWHEYLGIPGLGYLTRIGVTFRSRLYLPAPYEIEDEFTEDLNEDDQSTLPPQAPRREPLAVQQYIVYSPTFQVPAFYFTIHDGSGSPLSLQEISQTALFHAHTLPERIEIAPHGISMPASNFPLLSQGDHPVLGTPCWYFHPCETSAAVTELLKEGDLGKELTAEQYLLHWIEAGHVILDSKAVIGLAFDYRT